MRYRTIVESKPEAVKQPKKDAEPPFQLVPCFHVFFLVFIGLCILLSLSLWRAIYDFPRSKPLSSWQEITRPRLQTSETSWAAQQKRAKEVQGSSESGVLEIRSLFDMDIYIHIHTHIYNI